MMAMPPKVCKICKEHWGMKVRAVGIHRKTFMPLCIGHALAFKAQADHDKEPLKFDLFTNSDPLDRYEMAEHDFHKKNLIGEMKKGRVIDTVGCDHCGLTFEIANLWRPENSLTDPPCYRVKDVKPLEGTEKAPRTKKEVPAPAPPTAPAPSTGEASQSIPGGPASIPEGPPAPPPPTPPEGAEAFHERTKRVV